MQRVAAVAVPERTSGFSVYAEGSSGKKIQNFTLFNCTFNFIGNNRGGWDYGVFIDYVDNAVIYGNNLNCSLPLRSVNWQADIFGGVSMDTVGAFVAQGCDYLTLSNNNISAYVSGGGSSYPTLDTIILYGCNNATVEKNRTARTARTTTFRELMCILAMTLQYWATRLI